MSNKIKLLLFIVTLVLTVANPLLAMAQGTTATPSATASVDVPVYQNVQQSVENFLCTPSEKADSRALEKCVNKIYRFGISFGAIALVFFLVYAGYVYITSGEGGKEKAKGIVQNAIVGMALLLGSYVLLRFINPELVVFKPIQPPIFTAADLPSCDKVGLGEDCILYEPGGGTTVGTGGYIACPDGLIDFDKKVIQVNQGNDTQKICKSMWTKLVAINSQQPIIATATIGSGHSSDCHASGNPKSGTCVDIVPKDGNYAKLCQAIKSVGNVVIVNESAGSEADCGKARRYSTTTGNHLHIYLTNGGDGSATGGSGPRPYCKAIHGFLCDHPSGFAGTFPTYSSNPKAATTSSDPVIQANINRVLAAVKELQKKHPNVRILQLYRPHEYGAHMRSVFEAGALMKGQTEAQIKTKGFYCNGSIQYIKKSDIDNASPVAKAYVNSHWDQHGMSLASTYDTTCLSDHGFGYGVDLSNATSDSVERDAEAFGLCHNLPGDTNHYVLKDKNRNNKGCNW